MYWCLDRSVNSFMEKIRQQKSGEYEFTTTTKGKSSQQSLLSSSKPVNISSSDDEETKANEIIAECEKMLEQTQKLKNADSQFLKPEDYVRLRLNSFLDKNEVMVKNARCSSDNEVINCKINNNKSLELGKKSHKTSDELIGSKGFCSYVSFVTSYIIFLIIVTFLLSRIGKI